MEYLCIILSALLGIYGFLGEGAKNRFKWCFVLFIFLLAIIQISISCEEKRKAMYSKSSGKLISKVQSNNGLPAFVLCKSRFEWTGGKNKPIFILGEDPITVRVKDGKALFTMTIRDKDGEVIASLVENDWFIVQGRVFDWNFSEDTLEIIDKKKDVLFQVEVKGNDVRIAGKTYFKNGGDPVLFTPLLTLCDYDKEGTIFQYPRDLHPGEKVNYSKK